MLRVFDPRAQLTPVQVSPLIKPSPHCQNTWQLLFEDRTIKCIYLALKTLNLVQTELYVALFKENSGVVQMRKIALAPVTPLPFTVGVFYFPTPHSDKHIESNPVSSPLATLSDSSTIDLWMYYTSCRPRSLFFSRVPIPHLTGSTMNVSTHTAPYSPYWKSLTNDDHA